MEGNRGFFVVILIEPTVDRSAIGWYPSSFNFSFVGTAVSVRQSEVASLHPVGFKVNFLMGGTKLGNEGSRTLMNITEIWKRDSRRALASLVRLLRDFDLAEDALQEAYLVALERWPHDGIPDNPCAWLISTGRFKAIDIIRRRQTLRDLHPELSRRWDEVAAANGREAQHEISDDRLRMIFACCHPAIDPQVQVPLTLREVCGLTTEEIASGFLVAPATMAQRIVRGKAKIRDARIPIELPTRDELPNRLESILSVIYLVYSEGYSASQGETVQRVDLANEAIRLARLVFELLPQPEVAGLLGLMLLHESRRMTRVDDDGDIVLLEDQDRGRWDRQMIGEGVSLVQYALRSRQFGAYTVQAAIAAVHAESPSNGETDWRQIASLYGLLQQISPSPVIELNWAVAVSMRDGPQAGLDLIAAIEERGELKNYHLLHAARGELLRRDGQFFLAREAVEQALSLAQQKPERRYLQKKLTELESQLEGLVED